MKDRHTATNSPATSTTEIRQLDSFTQGYVQKCARQLIGRHGFTDSDRAELEQTLFLKLAGKFDQADPDNPHWRAFVAKTVSRQIASVIRDRKAPKRDHRRTISIHVLIKADEEGPLELVNVLQEHEKPSRRSQELRCELELADLREDVATCIERLLDPRFRELCKHLMNGSVAEAARSMDVPRSTIDAWLPKIRQRFEEMGLSEYLRIPS